MGDIISDVILHGRSKDHDITPFRWTRFRENDPVPRAPGGRRRRARSTDSDPHTRIPLAIVGLTIALAVFGTVILIRTRALRPWQKTISIVVIRGVMALAAALLT
jgi:hypothetical protein